jgi:uncharacterized protein (UPF0548 family)
MKLLPRLRISAGPTTLRRMLAETAGAPFSYRDAGASRGPAPSGYRPIERRAVVGHGPAAFQRLADGIVSWQVHRESGVAVLAAAPRAAPAVEVALAARTAGLVIVMSCRVIYVLDQPTRKGFAYGSLPGHPEAGEETFIAEIADDGAVTFAVGGFSRPGTVLTTFVSPFARALAGRAIDHYLVAARKIAAG